MKPVVAIYSTFLQRAYDQLIHDVALQNLPVVFAIDRAGVVGADGATHNGAFDFAYLRCLPNMTVMAPADENECRQMLYTAITLGTPAAVRYPRGTGPGVAIDKAMTALPIGKGEVRRERRAAYASHRDPRVRLDAAPALAAGEELDATVANMRFVKPLDVELVARLAQRARRARHDRGRRRRRRRRAAPWPRRSPPQGIAVPMLHLGLPDTLHRPRRSGVAARAGRARREGHRGVRRGRALPSRAASIGPSRLHERAGGPDRILLQSPRP